MKSVIVGTAGHIDHGKTSLVKALTGIDADRLEEEKRRGITIDIGFAHLELPAPSGETLRLGFVDVPGHERFVRNMLAGVGGIDLVVLVIAADEGIKPQTREHFDICRLLAVRRGMTVLTKSDAVDRDTLEVVRLEVEDFLRGSFLDPASSPIVAASSLTGAGLDEVKTALAKIASEATAKDSTALARLPIDRVFTMKGFGTVVTGTLVSGTIRKDEDLEIFPGGRRVRVRGVQVHGSMSEEAVAGQRTALNLAGISTEDLARGMTLAVPGVFSATQQIDVRLTLLPTAKRLKNRSRVHFHSYTDETIATIRLWGAEPGFTASNLEAGRTGLARLALQDRMQLLPGDRFILRQFSPVVTIGGGVVADAHPPRSVFTNGEFSFAQFLPLMLDGPPEEILHRRIARRFSDGFTTEDLVRETGWSGLAFEANLASLARAGRIRRFGNVLMDARLFESLKSGLPAVVESKQTADHLREGIPKEELHSSSLMHPAIFDAMLDELVNQKKLEVVGERIRIPGRGVVMKDEESESKKIIEQAFASAGLKVPSLKEVLAGLKVDKLRAQKIVTLLLRDKVLIKISEELVFHQSALTDLRHRVTALKSTTPKIDVARFKDMTGVSRKYAIPLLEYLDRERVTRRVGDERVIL